MDDSLSEASKSSQRPSERAASPTNWNEAGYSRFQPAPTLRQSLPWILLVLLLAAAFIVLLMAVLSPPRRTDGPRYPLPSYVYLNGHCHHRSRAGIVIDELCEEALSKPGSGSGARGPRLVRDRQPAHQLGRHDRRAGLQAGQRQRQAAQIRL